MLGSTGVFNCLLISSSDGMPGVGVFPGLNGLLNSFGSGMPGVGVGPFGNSFAVFASGIPGVLPLRGKGLVENPGGRSFSDVATFAFPLF